MNEKPARAQHRGEADLNRAIQDQGWYEMHRPLTYKKAWRGGMYWQAGRESGIHTPVMCLLWAYGEEYRLPQARFV